LLGWTPQRAALEDIVRDAWNFLQRHPNGYAE
jgi:UDP-glucose 4-epimerase